MFLDTFAENSASESIDLVDLELECAVSLEVAYNDLMLEGCQVEFQGFYEGSSLEAINEGIFDVIKKFFRTIWNFLKKIFGIKGSGGSSGGGSSGGSTNTKDQKKEAEDLDKEVEESKDEIEFMLDPSDEMKKKKIVEKWKKKWKELANYKIVKKLRKKERDLSDTPSFPPTYDDVEDKEAMENEETWKECKHDLLEKIKADIQEDGMTIIDDPFISICPISKSFFESLIDKMNELCESIRDIQDIDQHKFETNQKLLECEFLRAIIDAIDETTKTMTYIYGTIPMWRSPMDQIDSPITVSKVIGRYKEITTPHQFSVNTIIGERQCTYKEFKDIVGYIKMSAEDELNIDFQSTLNKMANETMNDIKQNNSYSNENIGSLIARIKMRLITDLSQIIGAIGIENKKARFIQLNNIRNILHIAKKINENYAKLNDEEYINSTVYNQLTQRFRK